VAQPPAGVRPAAVYNTPFPTSFGPPGGAYARPATPPQPAARHAAEPAPRGTATGRPDTGPPPGYRPVGGSGPSAVPPRAETPPAPPSGGGQVMYFHKPADALAVSGADSNAVAQVSAPPVVPAPVPDVPVGLPRVAPPAADRAPLAGPAVPLAAPVVQEPAAPQQPAAQPEAVQPKAAGTAVPPEVTQIPSRDKIFMMYDNAQLERAIVDWVVREKKVAPGLTFPRVPALVPAGTQYTSRTGTLPPTKAVYEPGFVVHRRLHFEEKNSERYGWDLGFITPVVSTAYFYKDVLLWPNSLATGVVTGFWDTSAGKCLPGSPVPYYFYPPGLTITGTTVEGLVITGAAFVIP
jgi:hypothetical protein